jgi:hypothetical protein
MKEISKNTTDKKLDFISGYQMLGGLTGIAFIVYMIFNIDEINWAHILTVILGVLLYTFSFISGLFLYQRKKNAIKLSLLNQIFQIIGFSFWGFGFEYVSGLSFDLFIRNTDGIDFSLNFGLSNWHMLINKDTGIQEISINLIALYFLFYISRLRKEYTQEILSDQVSNIGTS